MSMKMIFRDLTMITGERMADIKKCLFPAAGFGTRFLPATKAVPKEMLPVLTKPLIQYGVEEAVAAGMDIMGIVTGKAKKAIEDHFDKLMELEALVRGSEKEALLHELDALMDRISLTYIRQREMKGLGHAIYTGKPLIGDEPFAVILPDDLCVGEDSGVLSQMVELYQKYKCSIVALEEIDIQDSSKYGVIAGDFETDSVVRIQNMVEKPAPEDAPSNLAIIGRYILTPDIFDILENTAPGKAGEIQITDALMKQAQSGNVIGYKFKGRRFDCGSVKGFVAATNYFFDSL